MPWLPGPAAVQCARGTAPGFRRGPASATPPSAQCHDVGSDHTPSIPAERVADGARNRRGLAGTTHPEQRRHQVGQLWERQKGQQVQQQQQQQQQQQRHHPESPATSFKNQQWRQHQKFSQGPDALMCAIMEAATVRDLQSVVHAEFQATNGDDASSLTSTSAEAAKRNAASGMAIAVPTTRTTASALWKPWTAPRMRPIHVAAAIVRLSKLPYNSNSDVPVFTGVPGDQSTLQQTPEDLRQQLLQLLLELACSQAGALTARQLVNVIWALGRLEADKAHDGGGDGGKAGRSHGVHAAATAAAAAAAAQPPSISQLEILVSELLGQKVRLRRWGEEDGEEGRLHEDDEEDVDACRHDEEEEAEAEADQRVSERDSLDARTVAATVSQVVGLQVDAGLKPLPPPGSPPPPPPPPRSIGKLHHASHREVANFAWAAAQLRLRSPPLWTAVCREAEGRLQPRQAGQAERGSGSGSGSFNAADLANLSWALARAGQLPGGPLAEALVRAAMEQIEEFDGVSLAGLIWGLGTLAANTPPPGLTRAATAVVVPTSPGCGGGGDGGGGGDKDCGRGEWATRPDLLPLLLQRATPRVVSELAQQRMRPREVLSLVLGLSAATAATARRPGSDSDCGGGASLLQALADYVASNAPAFVGCNNSRTVRGGVVQHVGLDNLANVLLALVRCVEARTNRGGGGGLYVDPRVARRVERALEAAARQVVRHLPRAAPESLTALAVAFSNRLTATGGGGGIGGGGPAASVNVATAEASVTAPALAMMGTEPANDFVAASSSGLFPSPAPTGPVVPPIRGTVLRALLRAAVRLLPALPLPSPPPPPPPPLGATNLNNDTTFGALDGGGGGGNNSGGGGGLKARHMREIVGVLWWCTQGLGGGAEGAAEELRLAAPWIERALPLCRPADLALLAAAYARAGCHPPSLEAALSAAARSAASAMSPLDISQLAWAAATAATANIATAAKAGVSTAAAAVAGRDALLLSALEQRSTALLRDGAWAPGQELAIVMWSFAKLNHYSEPLLDAVAEVLRPARGAVVAPAALPARQAKAPSAATAVAAGAAATARLESPTVLQPLLRLSPHEVAMVAAALGQLRYYDSVLMRSLAARVEADVGRYSGRALTWALSAFACLNSYHPGLLRAAAVRVRQLLRMHHHLPPSRWRPAAQPGLVSEGADVDDDGGPFTTYDAVALLWSFGVMQHVDLECLQGLIWILPRDPRVYSVSDLSRLGLADVMLRGALACLHRRRNVQAPPRLPPPSHPAAAAAASNSISTSSNVNAPAAGGGGSSSAEDDLAARSQRGLLPEPLRAAVAAAARSQRSRVSGLQREVAAALRGMGLRPRMEVAMGVFCLDLRLDLPEGWQWEKQQQQQQQFQKVPVQQQQQQEEHRRPRRRHHLHQPYSNGFGGKEAEEVVADGGSGGGGGSSSRTPLRQRHGVPPKGIVRIAVEVDGPSHFCSNVPNHALGSTVARDRCLLDLSLQLVVVPHFEWDRLQSADARRAYLARRLAAAAAPQGNGPTGRPEADGRHSHTNVDTETGRGGAAGRHTASRALFPAMTITTQVARHSIAAPPPSSPPTISTSS